MNDIAFLKQLRKECRASNFEHKIYGKKIHLKKTGAKSLALIQSKMDWP